MIKDNIWLEKLDRVHPYPAKFPASTAERYILRYSKTDDMVFDPFVGSGSTLLAASANNRLSVGIDINSIAVLISRFKLITLSKGDIDELKRFEMIIKKRICDKDFGVLQCYRSIEHWFCKSAIESLSCIKNTINTEFAKNEKLKLFANLTMSAIINCVSNQESDTRYAAVEKPWITLDYVLLKFVDKIDQIIKIVSNCKRSAKTLNRSRAVLYNSKKSHEIIAPESVDLIVTSPPYPNTYDYYLYHKHRMLWLDEDFRYAMNEEIGSRREFSSLKKPKDSFADDLYKIFTSCNIVMKPNAKAVIIIGDGKIQGEMYDSSQHTIAVCKKIGWELIDYAYIELDRTSRSFQASFRTNGKREHVLTFKKGGK